MMWAEDRACQRRYVHPEHLWILNRQRMRCPGVTTDESREERRILAAVQSLLGTGDITPAGARLLTQLLGESDG